ncbi:MAG: hypothetical protein KDA92_11030 [Planctomycetales bacterium]|nr:hypothetical protein [Planctomycetales bacterium]
MRPRLLTIVVLLICAGLLFWRHRPTLEVDPDFVNEAIYRQLEQRVELTCDELPLGEALELFSQATGIEVEIDSSIPPYDPQCLLYPVTWYDWKLSGIDTLRLLLCQVESRLDFVIHADHIRIVPSDYAVDSSRYQVARVHVIPAASLGKNGINLETLCDTMTTCIEPNTWVEVGGDGDLRKLPGALLVNHHPRVQIRVERLIKALTVVESDPWQTQPIYLTKQRVASPALQESLKQTVAYLQQPASLETVVNDLRSQYDIPIVIDRNSLPDAGVQLDDDIDVNDSVVSSADAAIAMVLASTGLTAIPHDDVLCITAGEEHDEHLETAVFPVYDFLQQGFSFLDLTQLLETAVSPDSWDCLGGAGTQHSCGKAIVISQTPDVMRKIDRLFQGMRSLRSNPEIDSISVESPATIAALTKLATPVTLQRPEVTADELLREVLALADMSLLVNDPSVNAILDSKLTSINADSMPLSEVLDEVLKRLHLTPVWLDDSAIVIKNAHFATLPFASLQIYNVEHLVSHGSPMFLSSVIEDSIAQDEWDSVGGDWSINQWGGVLIVNASPSVQDQIGKLLAALRTAPDAYDRDELVVYRAPEPSTVVPTEFPPHTLRVYQLGRERLSNWATARWKEGESPRRFDLYLSRQIEVVNQTRKEELNASELAIENRSVLVVSCPQAEHHIVNRFLYWATHASQRNQETGKNNGWEIIPADSTSADSDHTEAVRDLSELLKAINTLSEIPADVRQSDFTISLELRKFLDRALSQLPFKTNTLYYPEALWMMVDSPEHLDAARNCIDKELSHLNTVIEQVATAFEDEAEATIADRLLRIAIDDEAAHLKDSAAWLLKLVSDRRVKLSAESFNLLAANADRVSSDLRWPVVLGTSVNNPPEASPLIPRIMDRLTSRPPDERKQVLTVLTKMGIAVGPALCKLLGQESHDMHSEIVHCLSQIAEMDSDAIALMFAVFPNVDYITHRYIAESFGRLPQHADLIRKLVIEYDRRETPEVKRRWQHFRAQLQVSLGDEVIPDQKSADDLGHNDTESKETASQL